MYWLIMRQRHVNIIHLQNINMSLLIRRAAYICRQPLIKYQKRAKTIIYYHKDKMEKTEIKPEAPADPPALNGDKKPEEEKVEEDVVDPFRIVAASDKGVDYDKLIKKFGCSKITPELLEKFEKITGHRPHRFLRRGIFFSHRDLDKILDHYAQKKPFFIYTGRGPSSEALHLGHMIPFMFTKYLQDVFDVPVVVQLTDDEKFYHKAGLSIEQCQHYAIENIKDIIAVGFNPVKTFIFRDTDYISNLYPNALKVAKHVTLSQIKGIFGFNDSDNVGKFAFPPIQAAPSFSTTFPHIFGKQNVPCLIPQAIDQDPYFRMTRDAATKVGLLKPACIHSSFFPALQGLKGKMSGSIGSSSIFCTDTPKQIKTKINKYAFSGGQGTVEEHRAKGANLDVDVSYHYLKFFLEDDEELAEIGRKYQKGELLTGEVKAKLVAILQEFVSNHQKNKAKIDESVLKSFMEVKKIDPMPAVFKKQQSFYSQYNSCIRLRRQLLNKVHQRTQHKKNII
eukprot:TRINITY_DN88123_c1_g1_i1.p1 TRINITY_DN88123_c1_g1~~TRINITY_DN88123_c1_g1_i1.p1  ORF type:complete len:507 (+),score=56.27 TRINITY_DN88123_c1_g1_i1:1657-3177(+)